MFPVFWLLVIVGLVIVWFIVAPIFTYIGRKIANKLDKTKKILNDYEEEKDE